jgi:hypothetical protein
MNSSHEQKLERSIHAALRELPLHRAPRSLEARVRTEIERRAALPWWKKSFAYWPAVARGAFLVTSVGLIALAVWWAAGFDLTPVKQAVAAKFAWWNGLVALTNAIASTCAILTRNIPALWLYAGVVFVGALYAACFGLGAAAYRTLYAPRRATSFL